MGKIRIAKSDPKGGGLTYAKLVELKACLQGKPSAFSSITVYKTVCPSCNWSNFIVTESISERCHAKLTFCSICHSEEKLIAFPVAKFDSEEESKQPRKLED